MFTDNPTELCESKWDLTKCAIAGGVALLLLFFVIDVICCKVNQCGLLACICFNCCGRGDSNRKERDLETGR